ncbi:MAG: hypothetical protein GX421_03710 [Caldisericales bacterium]|nr:hypothetical protein [Caldisericales bacterium]
MKILTLFPSEKTIEASVFNDRNILSSVSFAYPECPCESGSIAEKIAMQMGGMSADVGITCYSMAPQTCEKITLLDNDLSSKIVCGEFGHEKTNICPQILLSLAPKKALLAYPLTYGKLPPVAVFSGTPQIQRRIVARTFEHLLGARELCRMLGREYEQSNILSVYMSTGEISTCAHERGGLLDIEDSYDGEGAMTPTRSGFFHQRCVYKMALSGKYSKEQMLEKIREKSGILAHLGTTDLGEARKMARSGDKKAEMVYKAFIYGVAKSIGKMAATLKGNIDGMVFIGPLSSDGEFVAELKDYTEYIKNPVVVKIDQPSALVEMAISYKED